MSEGSITYSDACQMDIDDLMEANQAITILAEERKKQTDKAKKGKKGRRRK